MPDRLMKLIKEHEIDAERVEFEDTVRNSKDSANVTGLDLKKIVKTVLFKDKQDNIYAVIIRATEKVCKSKLKNALGTSKLELVGFDDVINRVSYPAGGVPPFGYEARFVMDADLREDEVVLVGGGTIYSLLKLKVSDIKKLSAPEILDVKKNI